MMKKMTHSELFQALFEDRPVYMMIRIDKTNAIEDMFGADAFYTEEEEPEKVVMTNHEGEEVTYTKLDPDKNMVETPDQEETKEHVIDKMMPLVANKTFPIIDEASKPEVKRGRKPSFDKEYIRELYLEGKKTSEIQRIVGCGHATVSRYISEMISKGEV